MGSGSRTRKAAFEEMGKEVAEEGVHWRETGAHDTGIELDDGADSGFEGGSGEVVVADSGRERVGIV